MEEAIPEPEVAEGEVVLWPGQSAVRSQTAGSVWQVVAEVGARVAAGDKLVVLETMKMETVVAAPTDGVVIAVLCKQGSRVNAGWPLLVLGT